MAGQATVDHLFRLQLREGDDRGFIAHRGDMLLPRAVTALAAGAFRRLVSARDAFEVRIAEEGLKQITVTAFARIAADISGLAVECNREGSQNQIANH